MTKQFIKRDKQTRISFTTNDMWINGVIEKHDEKQTAREIYFLRGLSRPDDFSDLSALLDSFALIDFPRSEVSCALMLLPATLKLVPPRFDLKINLHNKIYSIQRCKPDIPFFCFSDWMFWRRRSDGHFWHWRRWWRSWLRLSQGDCFR